MLIGAVYARKSNFKLLTVILHVHGVCDPIPSHSLYTAVHSAVILCSTVFAFLRISLVTLRIQIILCDFYLRFFILIPGLLTVIGGIAIRHVC